VENLTNPANPSQFQSELSGTNNIKKYIYIYIWKHICFVINLELELVKYLSEQKYVVSRGA
jgi:hypothetical protein